MAVATHDHHLTRKPNDSPLNFVFLASSKVVIATFLMEITLFKHLVVKGKTGKCFSTIVQILNLHITLQMCLQLCLDM